jgi:hypothetical protein
VTALGSEGPSGSVPRGPSGRRETPEERADRNLTELLQELRVALPGIQVMFAFLLIVPFTERFQELSGFQEKLYFGILLAVAAATALLIAPTVGHRLLFRRQEKEYLVTVGNGLALAGLFLMAVAMCAVIALISDFLFGAATAIISTAATVSVFGGFWYAGPLMRRRRD